MLVKSFVNFPCVTPLVGVWIEICSFKDKVVQHCVTPLVGVWIEILKTVGRMVALLVTPLVGVWIEMIDEFIYTKNLIGHSPCGSVD